MATYQNILYMLQNYGFVDVLLPFLLIFTIIFAVLQKSKILGEKNKNFNVIIALVTGLTVVIPHSTGSYPLGYDAVEIINQVLSSISILAVAAIMFLIIIGVFGAEKKWMGSSVSGWIAIFAFFSIALIFASAAGWTSSFYINNYIDSDTITLVVMILVFALIVGYITGEPGKGDSLKNVGEFFENVGNAFGKSK